MADSIIITANVTDGAIINSNVTESTAVTANVVTGAKGDKGDTGATGAAGVVQAVTDGTGIDVDATDPASPIVSLDPASIASLALADSAIQSLSDLSITSTAAELNYTDGVTSAIQTQLDGKSATSHTHTAADTTDFDTEVSNNTDVAANTAARHTHANSAVLDATTASFTTADETKLDGIAIGAQVNTVTSVNTRTGAVTGLAEASDLTAHTGNTSNPHSVTKAQVGLSNADNTSDVNKPISTATQTALDGKFTQRTITGTANQITVTNGDGVSGNPTLSLPQNIHTGASPTFAGGTINGKLNITTTGINTVLGTSTSVTGEANIDVTHLGTSSDTNRMKINHYSRNSAGAMLLNSQIQTRLSTTTAGAEVSQFAIQGYMAGVYGVVFNIDYGNIYNVGGITPRTNLFYSVGSSANYWANVYANKLFLNSTATLDGSTAGTVAITGNVTSTGTGSFTTVTAGTTTDVLGTALTVLRNNVAVGRIDNNASGLRVQAQAGTLQLRGTGNTGIAVGSTGKATFASDIEFSDTASGVILKSPDGTLYRVTVANGGTLTVTAA